MRSRTMLSKANVKGLLDACASYFLDDQASGAVS